MYVGRVVGSVVATIKISHLSARRLLLVDQLDLLHPERPRVFCYALVAHEVPVSAVQLMLDGEQLTARVLEIAPTALRPE